MNISSHSVHCSSFLHGFLHKLSVVVPRSNDSQDRFNTGLHLPLSIDRLGFGSAQVAKHPNIGTYYDHCAAAFCYLQ